MKIAFVYPRLKHQMLSSWAPRGLVVLASSIKNHEVKIFDPSFDKNFDKLKKELKTYKPDFLCMPVTYDLLSNAKHIASFVQARTILGGPLVTIEPDKVFSEFSADYLISGEAEEVIEQVIEGKIKTGKYNLVESPSIYQNDTIPNYSLLPTASKYFSFGTATSITSYGCPYRCSFCQPVLDKIFGKGIKFRQVNNVIKELIYLDNQGIDEIYLVDDTFGVKISWVKEFIEKLEQNNLKFKFLINTRANLLKPEFVKLLKKMNVTLVSVGVESGSQEILDRLNKDLKVEDTTNAFDTCHKHGIRTHANLMINNPGETKDTLEKTKKLIERIKPTTLYLSFLTPYPGTHIYEELNNRLNEYEYDDANCRTYDLKQLPIKNPNLSYEELDNFRKDIFASRRLFMIKNIIIFVSEDFVKAVKTFRWIRFFKKQFTRAKIFLGMSSYFG